MSKLLVDEISDADNTGPVTVTDGLNVSSGNVGVGISAPVKQIHVESATGGTIRLSSSDTSVDGGLLGEIDWYSNDSSTGGTGQKAYIKAIDNSSYGTGYALAFGTGIVSGGANVISERVRIDYDGIKFHGDTAADNALNDYEEGYHEVTLTPANGGSITLSATQRYLSYTKIGNRVFVTGKVDISSVSSPLGHVKISLPFPIDATSPAGTNDSRRTAGSIWITNSSINITQFVLYGIENESAIRIYVGDGTANQDTTGQKLSSTHGVAFTFNYRTA